MATPILINAMQRRQRNAAIRVLDNIADAVSRLFNVQEATLLQQYFEACDYQKEFPVEPSGIRNYAPTTYSVPDMFVRPKGSN